VTTDDEDEMTQLRRVNAEFKASLKQCHRIVSDCESRLTANLKDEPPAISPAKSS